MTTSAPISAKFLLAGKAIFTIANGKPAPLAADYTYRVDRKDGRDGRGEIFFVKLLTGPDNKRDYTYVGVLDTATGTIRLTAKSTYAADSKPVIAFNWAIGRIVAGKPIPAPASVLHAGYCGKCLDLLTVPESIARGLGPDCSNEGYTWARSTGKGRAKRAAGTLGTGQPSAVLGATVPNSSLVSVPGTTSGVTSLPATLSRDGIAPVVGVSEPLVLSVGSAPTTSTTGTATPSTTSAATSSLSADAATCDSTDGSLDSVTRGDGQPFEAAPVTPQPAASRAARKPRAKKAPKPTFAELRAAAEAANLAAGETLVTPRTFAGIVAAAEAAGLDAVYDDLNPVKPTVPDSDTSPDIDPELEAERLLATGGWEVR